MREKGVPPHGAKKWGAVPSMLVAAMGLGDEEGGAWGVMIIDEIVIPRKLGEESRRLEVCGWSGSAGGSGGGRWTGTVNV